MMVGLFSGSSRPVMVFPDEKGEGARAGPLRDGSHAVIWAALHHAT